MAKKKSLASTNPRYSYRTEKSEKDQVELQIKELMARVNAKVDNFYHIDQNTIFLEAVYRGLQYLERIEDFPDHANDEGYFQIEFVERPRECPKCGGFTVVANKSAYKCSECGETVTPKEYAELKPRPLPKKK